MFKQAVGFPFVSLLPTPLNNIYKKKTDFKKVEVLDIKREKKARQVF
jgi:hypothetical protein